MLLTPRFDHPTSFTPFDQYLSWLLPLHLSHFLLLSISHNSLNDITAATSAIEQHFSITVRPTRHPSCPTNPHPRAAPPPLPQAQAQAQAQAPAATLSPAPVSTAKYVPSSTLQDVSILSCPYTSPRHRAFRPCPEAYWYDPG